MKLSVKDRLVMAMYLPKEGSISDQLCARDINKKIELSIEEMDAIDLPHDKGRAQANAFGALTWDEEKAVGIEKEVEFSSAEANVLKDMVRKLDETKKINNDNLDICCALKDL